MIEIELDGQKVEVPEGSLLMHAAEKAGVYIPHFCYHKKLSIAANCRMCLVDVEKAPKPMPACATPAGQGMIVRTKSEKAIKAQQAVMEFLLINHPLDCPICDQGGECQLQDLAVGYGGSASRYTEEKRVVFHKNVGPLISMAEMNRCIHCTRCVRFGQEVAGVMELGMLHRGEHAEITTFVGQTVDSELSGNMIDICPVGALTSKPFRYSARTWELSRRKTISPHDSTGANLVAQIKGQQVMRVMPLENEAVNECWISDKDRFSYEALNSDERLTQPMLKQGGQWQAVDWPTALEYVANGLRQITAEHGPAAIGALASSHSTTEELHLMAKLIRALGSDNIDHRLRHAEFTAAPTHDGKPQARWLGMPIANLTDLQRVLVVGSFLRKDHPLFAQRLRQAARKGAQVHSLHGIAPDWLMPMASSTVVAPHAWAQALAEIAVAVAERVGVPAPVQGPASEGARQVAESLSGGQRKAVLLGNAAAQHPQASRLLWLANWIGQHTGATVGYLTEAANTVGAQWVGAQPQSEGKHAGAMLASPLKAYVLLHAEPELDTADPQTALAAMQAASMVVACSSFRTGAQVYADVLLPIAPFTETGGSYVNAQGTVQAFNGVVKPLGDTRPAWKVLRVLGNMLGLDGFDFESVEDVRAEALGDLDALAGRLNNQTRDTPPAQADESPAGLQRLADVPIYAADPVVRRAPALQHTTDAAAPKVGLPRAVWNDLGLDAGDQVVVAQGEAQLTLVARLEEGLAEGTVHISAARLETSGLGPMFGTVSVTKA